MFFFLLTIDFLIPEPSAQIFNPLAEPINAIEIPRKGAKAEIEIYPVIVETKIRKCSIYFSVVQTLLCYLLIISFCWISSRK